MSALDSVVPKRWNVCRIAIGSSTLLSQQVPQSETRSLWELTMKTAATRMTTDDSLPRHMVTYTDLQTLAVLWTAVIQ